MTVSGMSEFRKELRTERTRRLSDMGYNTGQIAEMLGISFEEAEYYEQRVRETSKGNIHD